MKNRSLTEKVRLLLRTCLNAASGLTRQWVLSLPIEIRYRLAYDKKLLSEVLAVFLRVIGGWYKKTASSLGFQKAQWGSVSFLQRFGSSLAVNPHIHALGLDGVYGHPIELPSSLEFLPTPGPTDEEVRRLVETVAFRVIRLLKKRGVLDANDAQFEIGIGGRG